MTLYHKFFSVFKDSYLMYCMLGIIVSSCLGGGCAMLILENGTGFPQLLQLILITIACMGYNATVLADLKPKIVFNFLLSSIVLNLILIAYHVIA